jgi:energy-coupling factor transporter transmembrane protein EcfT
MKLRFGRARGRGAQRRMVRLHHDSPLRQLDARIKLALMILMTPAVTLPLARLLILAAGVVALLGYGRLLGETLRQIRRLAWLLAAIFAVDWAVIGLDFAVAITLRFTLILAFSTFLLATTTPEELRQGLRGLGVPYRYAFVLSLAFQSVPLMAAEWGSIREAQQARGIVLPRPTWRGWRDYLRDLVALAVPAVVLTTRRAWSLTEAAHARGLDSPYKPPAPRFAFRTTDWALAVGALAFVLALAFYH